MDVLGQYSRSQEEYNSLVTQGVISPDTKPPGYIEYWRSRGHSEVMKYDIVKLREELGDGNTINKVTPGEHFEIKAFTTISEIVVREPSFNVPLSKLTDFSNILTDELFREGVRE